MSGQRYTKEFKTQAAKKVMEHRHSIPEVAKRLLYSLLCANQ